MRHRPIILCLLLSAFSVFTGFSGESVELPDHPAEIVYDSLGWEVPLGDPYRVELKNGLRAYVAVDSQLPLVRISAFLRQGTLLDPVGKEGLTSLTARLMRVGGTELHHPDSLDALIDLLAMRLSITAAEDRVQLSASFLAEHADTAFAILQQVLLHPRFHPAKLEKEKKILIESIRHRYDDPRPTLDLAFQKSVYPATAVSRLSDERSVKRIKRRQCRDLHRHFTDAGRWIFSVAGSFDREEMIGRLESLFPKGEQGNAPDFPAIEHSSSPGCLVVHKPLSQVYVRFGIPLFMRPHPDYYPVSVANLLLGGGGFTSRLGKRVRSDAGLTYAIYSNAESNYTYPGAWYVEFFTKNESFTQAMSLIAQVIDSVREHGFSDKELADAKASLTGNMPSMFRSPFDIVSTYAWNEYYGRSSNIFRNYADSIDAITGEDVRRAINTHFDPSGFTYTIVGDSAEVSKAVSSGGFLPKALVPCRTVMPEEVTALP